MPCEVIVQLNRIIESDRRTIATYRSLFTAIFTAAVGVAIYFHYFSTGADPLMQFSGAALFPIAAPLVPAHIRRQESLRILADIHYECRSFLPTHPRCAEIQKEVDAIKRSRAESK